jgi:hypothetical protein
METTSLDEVDCASDVASREVSSKEGRKAVLKILTAALRSSRDVTSLDVTSLLLLTELLLPKV